MARYDLQWSVMVRSDVLGTVARERKFPGTRTDPAPCSRSVGNRLKARRTCEALDLDPGPVREVEGWCVVGRLWRRDSASSGHAQPVC
ncbi:hypothetical protein GN956_G12846 [Arapaima gigas]